MEIKKVIIQKKEIVFVYMMFLVGILGHLFQPVKYIMLMLTPFTLLLLGALVLFVTHRTSDSRFTLWIIITYMFTFLIEVIGVKTGLIFGEYYYGETLGFKFFDVPLIIGLNWALVILGSLAFIKSYVENIFFSSLLVGLICVLFDFTMEPVAIKLDYWNWINNIIPLQNYLAWFILALTTSVIFNIQHVQINSKISIHYLIAQFLFFITLNLFG